MIEYGRIARLKDDEAIVAFVRHEKCDRCAICSVAKEGSSVELAVPNTLGLNVDDYVKVEMFKRKIRLASILIYLLPLCLTALGAGLGVLSSIAASVILAVLGLVAGLAIALPIDVCMLRNKKGYKPAMVEACTEVEYTQNLPKPTK